MFRPILGWWSSADDVVAWTVDVPRPGKFAVSWTYACEPNAAGSRLIVEAAGKSLTNRVDKTENWAGARSELVSTLL